MSNEKYSLMRVNVQKKLLWVGFEVVSVGRSGEETLTIADTLTDKRFRQDELKGRVLFIFVRVISPRKSSVRK